MCLTVTICILSISLLLLHSIINKLLIIALILILCYLVLVQSRTRKRKQWMEAMVEKYYEQKDEDVVCVLICPEYDCSPHQRVEAGHARHCDLHPRVLGYETFKNKKEYVVFGCTQGTRINVNGEYKLKGEVEKMRIVPAYDEWRFRF